MGGNVFTIVSNPLLTPRMPPAVYFYVRQRCLTILSQFYTNLCVPIEVPAKFSYGDIDILVCGPLRPCPTLIADIGLALGAARIITPPASAPNLPIHLALPWPTVDELPNLGDDPALDAAEPDSLKTGQNRFIQLDLDPLPDYPAFRFQAFTNAHSGLLTLLGTPLRHAGLVLNDSSLCLRIPSIETGRKRATVPLTADRDQILDFLSMDKDKYWKMFESVEEMFKYTASCRFFTTKRSETGAEGDEQAENELKKVRHRDRHNHRRPVYVNWREEFVPRACETGSYDRDVPSRDEVRQEAFALWPEARGAYEAKVKAFEIGKQQEEVGTTIAAGVPVDVEALGLPLGTRGLAVKGLKKIIFDQDVSDGLTPEKPFRGPDGVWDVESVREFVRTNWKEVGRIGMERGHTKMVEKIAARKAK